MKRMYLSVMAAFFSVLAIAQESGGASVNITKTESSSSSNIPWVWIIAGIVFLILLIALLSGGRRGGSDTVVERKTIIKD